MAMEAAIDVGSNSLKLLVADIHADGTYRVITDQSHITGLAKGLDKTGHIDPGSASKSLACLKRYIEEARLLGATRIMAAGTAALRDAPDAGGFLERVQQELGLEIRVLSGDEEAALSRAVALRELPEESAQDVVFFDIGGGSSELTSLHAGTVLAAVSLQLGARRCTDMAGLAQPVTAAADRQVMELIHTALAAGAPGVQEEITPTIAGLGGTASSCVHMLAGQRGEPRPDDVHLTEVTLGELEELRQAIAPLDLTELQAWPHLDPERAPVMFAGISIIAGLLQYYGADRFTLLDRGLRYGLLLADTSPAAVE